jgi:hypothetical protein
VTLSPRVGAAAIALVFLAFHLSFPPASLEDLDSINFALGVRAFDVASHRPHPPGYPLFIAAGKAATALLGSESLALGVVGIAAGTAGVFALLVVYRRLDEEGSHDGGGWRPLAATLLAVTSPLYWFTASRPLSDTTGLAAALGVQALALSGTSRAAAGRGSEATLVGASALAALAVGIRSQVMWLTFPMLVYLALAPRTTPAFARPGRLRLAGLCLVAAVGGGLAWAVPLVVLTGGPASYWKALFSQGAEDLTNIQMLWTTPTPRELAEALYYALVAPWARWDVAAGVLALATVGAVRLWRRSRGALVLLSVGFLPYAAFDLLFQESFTTRYALPIVVPVAYLAVRGASAAGPPAGLLLVALLSAFDAHVGGTSLAAFAREEAPAFRMLRDMRTTASRTGVAAVLAADRREALDLRRPLEWVGADLTPFAAKLATPPKHEWLEAVRYWSGGGRAPVWFVVDPTRAQMELIHHGEPARYRWSVPYPVLLGGVRPSEMDWYRVDRPDWFLGEGWALTPEAAGVATEDRRGPGVSGIGGWVRRRSDPTFLIIGGRNLHPASAARVSLAVNGHVEAWTVPPGFFLRTVDLPPMPPGPEYVELRVTSDAPVAIEQFDAAPGDRAILGFGGGWLEQEYDPATGVRWRWLTERGQLTVRSDGRPLALRVEGDSPAKYYSKASRLIVKAGDRTLLDTKLSSDFSVDVPIPADSSGSRDRSITFETDQVFVPAERSRRSGDRRHLGLRIFTCRLVPAS